MAAKTSKTIHHFLVTAIQRDNGEWQFDIDNDTLDMFFHEGFYYDLTTNKWVRSPAEQDAKNDRMLHTMLTAKLEA